MQKAMLTLLNSALSLCRFDHKLTGQAIHMLQHFTLRKGTNAINSLDSIDHLTGMPRMRLIRREWRLWTILVRSRMRTRRWTTRY